MEQAQRKREIAESDAAREAKLTPLNLDSAILTEGIFRQ
jgi:hypothetical protein